MLLIPHETKQEFSALGEISCKVLKEYMQYVSKVRKYTKEQSLETAVERAVGECIKEDILREFLLKNKKEALEVSIFEYDEEATLQYIREDEFAQGVNAGRIEGRVEGKIEALMELLEEKGTLSNELCEKIKNQKDESILSTWLKLALKVESIEEFRQKIDG